MINTVNVYAEVDIDDVLSQIDSSVLRDYLSDEVGANNLDYDPECTINILYKTICENYGGNVNRIKEDFKKNVCEFIDDYFYTIRKNG